MTTRWLLFALLAPTTALAAPGYGPYQVSVVRVIDGDSVEVDVRLWPGLSSRVSLRLAGVNTPEKRGPECEVLAAAAATRYTKMWTADAVLSSIERGGTGYLSIDDVQPDKYSGRVLGRLKRSDGTDLGEALMKAGHARAYQGEKRVAWCH